MGRARVANPHGTLTRYKQGCHCDDCRRANREYVAHRRRFGLDRPHFAPDHLAVTCWCEQNVVHVPASEISHGRTGSCGRADCHE